MSQDFPWSGDCLKLEKYVGPSSLKFKKENGFNITNSRRNFTLFDSEAGWMDEAETFREFSFRCLVVPLLFYSKLKGFFSQGGKMLDFGAQGQ